MQHYPVFLDVSGRRILLAGGGETALAKLRLLLRTRARVAVFAAAPAPAILDLARDGQIDLTRRAPGPGDLDGAILAYAAHDDDAADAATAALARAAGVPVNVVDNLDASDFLTPAIVDRDPVVVAIGTEGAAPVLARAIKTDLEHRLPAGLGVLARIGKGFRAAAEALPMGRRRRDFWAEYYGDTGPRDLAGGGAAAALQGLGHLLDRHLAQAPAPGHVALVGAGPGDPELLTLRARRMLDQADVVIHDRLIGPGILDLARREAVLIDAGKKGFGASTAQADINAMMIRHAAAGLRVVRLKSGDPAVFGRLDEEIAALDAAGIAWSIVPGITAASAAAAAIGQSLTRRDRNSSLRLLTGHDAAGFAEHDWRALARPGAVAAIYMGKKSARFLQGRLTMHGAAPGTPVSVVENAGRPEVRVIATSLAALDADLAAAGLTGPAVILLGLGHHAATARLAPREVAL